jgi:hypothetical protein
MPRRRQPNRPPPIVDDRHPRHDLRIIDEGELLVTNRGDVVLDVPLRRSRALLVRSEEAVLVEFKRDDEPCPPCAGEGPDELGWEVVERRRDLFLKIWWRVNCARTIVWKIFEVD